MFANKLAGLFISPVFVLSFLYSTIAEAQEKVAANNIYSANLEVDVLDMSRGELIVIVQIKDENEEITNVKTARLNKVSIKSSLEKEVFVYPNPTKKDLFIQSDYSIPALCRYFFVLIIHCFLDCYAEQVRLAMTTKYSLFLFERNSLCKKIYIA